jgi:mannonate dehydratase
MSKFSRRQCVQGMLAAMAAAGSAPLAAGLPKGRGGEEPAAGEEAIKLCLIWGPEDMHAIRLARQMGVTHAIAGTYAALSKVPRSRYLDTVAAMKKQYDEAGMSIAGIESHPVPADKIKLGLAGRDEEIENYIAALKALGEVGIPMVCYEFMVGIGWYRSNMQDRGRGGVLTMSFDSRDAEKQGLTQWGRISEEQVWSNIEYFLKAVIPAAEKAGVKMALHPDDPPVSELRGIARILTSAENYRRVMKIVPSPANGVTFDHSIFYLMGENIQSLAREWCKENKVFFIHSRNVRGTRERFVETFQDNGKVDFGEMYRIYHDSGFRGPIRPDHDPIMDGESYKVVGYGILGKIFAIGYIKGIMAAQHIPYV